MCCLIFQNSALILIWSFVKRLPVMSEWVLFRDRVFSESL